MTAVGATKSSPVSGRRATEPRERRGAAGGAGASASTRVAVTDTVVLSVRRVQARLDLGLPVGECLVDVAAVDRRPDGGQPWPVRVVEQVAERQRERGVAVLEALRDELGPRVGG